MRLGVDVSEHQRGFDFSGFDFAIIRTTDGTYRDHAFTEHVSRAAGLELSAYHFLRAPSEGTTVEQQVDAAMEVLDGRHLPMWIDVESPAGLSLDDVRVAASCFQQAGAEVAGVYTTAWYWRRHMELASPAQFGALWLAQWGDNPVVELAARSVPSPAALDLPVAADWPQPFGFPRSEVWQFTSRGRIGGHTVDLNVKF